MFDVTCKLLKVSILLVYYVDIVLNYARIHTFSFSFYVVVNKVKIFGQNHLPAVSLISLMLDDIVMNKSKS